MLCSSLFCVFMRFCILKKGLNLKSASQLFAAAFLFARKSIIFLHFASDFKANGNRNHKELLILIFLRCHIYVLLCWFLLLLLFVVCFIRDKSVMTAQSTEHSDFSRWKLVRIWDRCIVGEAKSGGLSVWRRCLWIKMYFNFSFLFVFFEKIFILQSWINTQWKWK